MNRNHLVSNFINWISEQAKTPLKHWASARCSNSDEAPQNQQKIPENGNKSLMIEKNIFIYIKRESRGDLQILSFSCIHLLSRPSKSYSITVRIFVNFILENVLKVWHFKSHFV